MEVHLDGILAGSVESISVRVGNLVLWLDETPDGGRLRIWGDSADGDPLTEIDLGRLGEAYESLPELERLALSNGWDRRSLLELTDGDAEADYAMSIGSILWHALESGDDPEWLEEMLGQKP